MPANAEDRRWLAAAARLAARGSPSAHPNPAVGAILVAQGRVLGRGWTHPGGRPHAEAVALAMAGEAARGGTLYVTLEPCAHAGGRGPACSALIAASGIARLVAAVRDPDPRTDGKGFAAARAAGITADHVACAAADESLAGYLTRARQARPRVTLKLATSLDGMIALANGASQWITGAPARAHAHALRARMDAVLVGGETLRADAPRLDVRLPGIDHVPRRWVLTRGGAPAGWSALADPAALGTAMLQAHDLLIEGGGGAAAAFLAADLVDRLVIYRAPVLLGSGRPAIGSLGLTALDGVHGKWVLSERRQLGSDTLEVYSRVRCSQA
ncbi:bifunctional diaminohydroxyphosphoribosylaminopyrimidine deaminase/5-amino-6-(5-phosphoribosylamino)uracil reductase RibD [Parablastomonas sp. CN1-191]|uniref:bifunctional diaminohydroxyphosphoribosylaminopyrimidine deaminase/5-amino-6-(5-phosphoribosylamino)uracil reductase RibD n=1 Tax=Parablastomonas sp. CN1-191 TaxID=3400908 RepID=UPI003BF83417